jgi:hypothetical protein
MGIKSLTGTLNGLFMLLPFFDRLGFLDSFGHGFPSLSFRGFFSLRFDAYCRTLL